MKLDTDIVDYIFNVVKTAKLVNIDNIIIEPDMVRAMNESRTVVLHSGTDVAEMPFGSIGITRISDLMSRYNIINGLDKFVIEATSENDEYVTKLLLKAKGLKIDYRCGDPRKINAPKQINDTLCYKIQLTDDAVKLLQQGAAAMSSENVSIISDEGVSFELADINTDTFNQTFADHVDLIPDENGEVPSSSKFAHRYPVKTLLALFKSEPTVPFNIGQRGIMSFPINGLTVYVLPQV